MHNYSWLSVLCCGVLYLYHGCQCCVMACCICIMAVSAVLERVVSVSWLSVLC